MSQNKNVEKPDLQTEASDFLKAVKDFAMTVGEDCPEGHRRDARSGACLPMGPTDYTAFTRSLNDDQGDLWRGLKDKQDQTFAAENKEQALDAADMDAPVSCGQGTTFSFIQRKCVSLEEAEAENNEDFARTEEGAMVYEEGQNGHEEVIALDPEGRKDTPGFDCPPDQMFDFNLRECIPLNKDTLMAGENAGEKETAAPITTKQRKALPDSIFGVPGKRKFPLDTCGRVRNAMARFNQAKGLTAGEKATLRRKILAAAKKCGIQVRNFAKAMSDVEFQEVLTEMLPIEKRVREAYEATAEDMKMDKKSPCPPFMTWDPKAKKCMKAKGFIQDVLSKASHQEIIALDPAGRKDTPGFKCPDGYAFDFNLRKCISLDPSKKTGQPGDTTKAAQNDLVPSPAGRPAKIPTDCPAGTIWHKDLEKCIPLDTRKKVANQDAQAGDEGLVPAPEGQVKLPSDCPAGTIWDANRRTCTPLNPEDKTRQGTPGPYNPEDLASVDKMTPAQLIKQLDEIIKAEVASGRKEKSKMDAKDLPNEAFPPSLVATSRRSLMHHNASVSDPYDNGSVDVSRLRNSLARVNKVEGYSTKAVEEALNHLMEHARTVVKDFLGKN